MSVGTSTAAMKTKKTRLVHDIILKMPEVMSKTGN